MGVLNPIRRDVGSSCLSLRIRPAVFAVVVCVIGLGSCARAQSSEPTEYEVKAAFVFNFTKFVEWPESAFDGMHSPFAICILGDDPFNDNLTRIVEGQKIQRRAVLVRRLHFGDDLRACHILFVSTSERSRVTQILTSVQAANTLTISDIESFASNGGVMQFLLEEDRIRFVVNLDAAEMAKLHVSAKLLALARSVINRSEVRKGN